MRFSLKPLLIALCGLGLCAGLYAGNGNCRRGNGAAGAGPRSAAILAKYDANADGTLSAEERATLHQDMLALYDADGDGTLSATERKTMRQERRRLNRQAVDTNGDGVISAEERAAACTGDGVCDGTRKGRAGK